MIDISSTAAELDTLAHRLETIDARAANRLHALSMAIRGSSLTDAWRSSDIYQAIAPDTIVEHYRDRRLTQGPIARFLWLRNISVFLLLLFAWVSLAEALITYGHFLQEHPAAASEPFFILWQQAFANSLPVWFALNNVVIIESALLLTSVVFILLIQLMRSSRKREAEELRSALADTLSNASLCLATLRRKEPDTTLDIAQKLLVELREERKRLDDLATRREKELGDLATFTSGVSQVSREMLQASRTIQQASTSLTAGIEKLAKATDEITTQQYSLLDMAKTTINLLENVARALADWVTEQKASSQELADMTDTLNITIQQTMQITSSIGQSSIVQKDFLQYLQNEREAQTILISRVSEASVSLGTALQQIDNSALALRSMSVDMSNLVRLQASLPNTLRNELLDVLHNFMDAAKTISNGGNRLEISASSIHTASQELAKVIVELHQHLDDNGTRGRTVDKPRHNP